MRPNIRSVPALAALLALGALGLGPESRGEGRRHRLTIDSDLQVRYVGQTRGQAVAAATRLEYRLEDRPGERDVRIDAVEVRVASGGNSLIESRMGPDGARFRLGAQEPARYSLASAPPNLRRLLGEFGQPAATIRLDESGAEAGRMVHLAPESPLAADGAIDNALLFHPPYRESEGPWRAPARLSISGGQHAVGVLTYQQAGEGPGGTVRVQVSGELAAEGKLQGGEVRKGTFKVSGEQFYDRAAGAWASGHLTVDVAFDLIGAGPNPGAATGTLTLHLLELPPQAER